MTFNNDIILKSWLSTLRYTIECYENTCDLKNNRECGNNRGGAKKMNVGGKTNEDSDDERYVNIWECSDSEKSASENLKLKNSLESVNNSDVSTLERDNSSFSTQSGTDLSCKSYVLKDTQSMGLSFEATADERSKITDLDEEFIVKKPRKPKVTPRASKNSTKNEAVYVNLPLRTTNSTIIPEDIQQQTLSLKHDHDSQNTAIYQNIPLRPQTLSISSKSPEESIQSSPENSPIYVNFPLFPQTRQQSHDSLSDESNFEEKVCSTIQYLENVLDSVSIDSFSDSNDSDIEGSTKISNFNPANTFDSDVSSINSKIEENSSLFAQHADEERFTESSSSFEEYVSKEHLNSSTYSSKEVQPQNLNQKFAKDNRVSAFFEEPEPLLHQEVKDIPVPKSKTAIFVPQNRCSVPVDIRDVQQTFLNVKRPQSLQGTGFDTVDIEEFESFKEYLIRGALDSSKVSIDGLKPQNLKCTEKHIQATDISEECLGRKSISCLKMHTDDCDSLGEEIEDSKIQNHTISFAIESSISTIFDEEVLQELEVFEVASENIIFEGEQFFEKLTEDVLVWMDDLMGEDCCEKLDIMEEKELLKSINQIPKDRFEKPPENKFPLVDDHVEIRRNQSIQGHRVSKTTDFDLGWRKHDSPINSKNFDIPGIVKFQLPNNQTFITKLNQEYVAYENENFYRITKKPKGKIVIAQNISIKSARYLNSRSKESKEVELKDTQNLSYILYFDSIKSAKQFMENEKVQTYVTDNKVTIKKTLLRFLGKRSSREILEKKGIYKNEPIFGNTLRDIYIKAAPTSGSPVPMFIYRVIELIEKLENIKSLGLYRTSGNLATIQKIRFEVDNGRLEILNHFSKDPDVLTGSLKLFFRELKEPLISCEICEKLMEVTKLDPKQMSSKEHQKIKTTLMKNMYEANLETFYVVVRHLLNVVKYKEFNKMDTYNLSVCWGPSMIFSVHGANTNFNIELSKDIVTQSHDATRLVDFLLGYYELFPSELDALSKRPESVTEKILALKRQESRDSVESSDSSKSQKKSLSNLTLSVDEITKKLVEIIEPNISTEGLYKKHGSPDKTNKLMKKLNKKKINELDKYKTDVHEMTDALKKYLREQDGLVTREIIELVLKATDDNSQNYLEPITRRKVTLLIEETPKKDTLIYILRHLAKVIDHQAFHKVSKNDIIGIWTDVLDHQRKCQVSYEDFNKFLTVAVEVFNDNLPDIVRSSFNNNGSSPNRNNFMGEVVKQIKNQQERDRNSRYDNVDCDTTGEASILEDKTEQTKL